ncbi:unnamed protein product [Phytophthora lilii]|uniref:Unnamed protein product n=1 Tax=Phytophthora lilii TaxID=2077276 RepID=A0A9W6XEG1_9STRA|nr:unnamed protein product [Phytophthora lilii]
MRRTNLATFSRSSGQRSAILALTGRLSSVSKVALVRTDCLISLHRDGAASVSIEVLLRPLTPRSTAWFDVRRAPPDAARGYVVAVDVLDELVAVRGAEVAPGRRAAPPPEPRRPHPTCASIAANLTLSKGDDPRIKYDTKMSIVIFDAVDKLK